MILRIAILIQSLFLISCEKQVEPAETVAQQIKKVIETRNVSRVVPAYNYSDYFSIAFEPGSTWGSDFSIEKDFITVESVSWNLNLVKNYRLTVINSKMVMGLFF